MAIQGGGLPIVGVTRGACTCHVARGTDGRGGVVKGSKGEEGVARGTKGSGLRRACHVSPSEVCEGRDACVSIYRPARPTE